jgi:serine/threonine protein kinase
MISDPAIDRLQQMIRAPDLRGTRYELISILGEGGMGVVFLARDVVLDREVAVKVLDGADSAAAVRLGREARILARLEHPGIVPVHDFGELADGRIFYAMKRVRGERLDRWVAAGAGLRARLGVFVRICEAVAFAHAHGVIHRDLKPENVMVGEFGEVLVLDWGIALLKAAPALLQQGLERSAGSETSRLSRPAGSGTPPYMAPEQERGDDVDERADVYALGTILAEIVDRAPALLAIAAKARRLNRADRYPSVDELSADIARFLAGEAVAAHRETIIDRTRRFIRRYRTPIALVLTYVVVRLLLLWMLRT